MKNIKYKPDYLKVSKNSREAKDIGVIISEHLKEMYDRLRFIGTGVDREVKPICFGSLRELFRIDKFTVLKFNPLSVDVGAAQENETLYKTREEALTEAIEYLKKNGYNAESFDLERAIV